MHEDSVVVEGVARGCVMGEGSVEDEGGEVDEGSVEGEEDEVDEWSEWGVGSSCKQDCYDGKKSLHIASLCVANF